MAENPTSSSTIYTTFGAPPGAFGGSNGAQSGTESLMSTLIVPLNRSLISPLLPPKTCDWFSLWRDFQEKPPQRCPRGSPAARRYFPSPRSAAADIELPSSPPDHLTAAHSTASPRWGEPPNRRQSRRRSLAREAQWTCCRSRRR